MKPDWDALGDEYADSKTVVIGDVDCTAAGKPLCEKYGVRGCAPPARPPAAQKCRRRPRRSRRRRAPPPPTRRAARPPPTHLAPPARASADPTIKYFNPPDEEGEDYKGGRSLADLKKFAKNELGPGCSVDSIENCTPEQKTELEKYTAMSEEERATKLEKAKEELKTAEDAHNELLKQLQSTYKDSQDKLEKLKEDTAPVIKMLKAATSTKKAGGKARAPPARRAPSPAPPDPPPPPAPPALPPLRPVAALRGPSARVLTRPRPRRRDLRTRSKPRPPCALKDGAAGGRDARPR